MPNSPGQWFDAMHLKKTKTNPLAFVVSVRVRLQQDEARLSVSAAGLGLHKSTHFRCEIVL